VELNAQARYDIGLYFAIDGDLDKDPSRGTCSITTLPYRDPPTWLDLDGVVGGFQNTCGDVDSTNTPLSYRIELTAVCEPSTEPGYEGLLRLPYCASWDNTSGNICTSPMQAVPNNASKCRCDDGFTVPIPIPGQIIVDKVTDPPGATESFGFSLTGGYDDPLDPDTFVPVSETFSLTDAALPWKSSMLYEGTYTVAETTFPNGWELDTATCVSDKRVGSFSPVDIVLNPGETVTCTFNNKQMLGWLKLVKTVTNDDGGTLLKTNFQAYIDDVAKDWDTSYEYIAGEYDIREATQTGYTASAWTGTNCSGGATTGTAIVLPGQTTTCYITNDDIAPTLKLVKAVTKDDGGDAVPNDWTLYATAAEPKDGRNFSNLGGSGVFKTVYANVAYTLTESTVAGYTAGNWVCTGGNLVGNVLTLGLDVNVTCTITNDDIAPTLKLVKSVINNDGGTAVPNDWTLYATAAEPNAGRNTCTITNKDIQPKLYVIKVVDNKGYGTKTPADFTMNVAGTNVSPTSFPGASVPGTLVTLNQGTYLVTETVDPMYNVSYSADCSSTIMVGQTKTCTVTNTFKIPGWTPGFWKNHGPGAPHGKDAWQYTAFMPGDLLDDVFELGMVAGLPVKGSSTGFIDKTLMEALGFRGGGGESGAAEILLRAAVASLLNASFAEEYDAIVPGLFFPMTVDEVIEAVNEALDSFDRYEMLTLAAELDMLNNGSWDFPWDLLP
jgi:hypothetical protein